jgi:ligand-binding sensor domain-containing protein
MVKTITILFWLFSVNLYGQPNVVFDQLTYKDGLSFNDIIDITKDSKGFMWFATENGLNRYNAYEFKQFMHHADDSTSLGYNNMRAI